MQNAIACLGVLGLAQAANVLNTRNAQDMPVEGDLHIKMPEASMPEKMTVKETPKVGLSFVQSHGQVDMFENSILHSSLKPILAAKVKKTMTYFRHFKDEYEQGTVNERSAIREEAHALALNGMGLRNYNQELCWQLWGQTGELASTLSFFYCPSITFSDSQIRNFRNMEDISLGWIDQPLSRERSAHRTFGFWSNVLFGRGESFQYLYLKSDVKYWSSSRGFWEGRDAVLQTLPYIGWPEASKLSNPVEWHCDLYSCIAPISAWSGQSNYVYAKFHSKGIEEIIIPLDLWR